MSNLNIAFISDELASGFITNLLSDVDNADRVTSTKASVDCNKCNDEGFMMTTCSMHKESVNSEGSVQQCVWETCYTLPLNHINSNAAKMKLHEDESQVKSGHRLKPKNHMKQKKDAKSKNRGKANNGRKKSQHIPPEKTNVENRNDVHVVDEAPDANTPSAVSSIVVTECVENVTDHMPDLPTGFECSQGEMVSPCIGDDVNLLQTISLSASVCQEDLVGLPDKNSENCDESNNMLTDEIMLEKDCQEKVEMLQSYATVHDCQDFSDSALSSTSHTVQFNNCAERVECVPSTSEENILVSEQQEKVILRKSKRRRSRCVKPGMSTNLEQQNEIQNWSEADCLSTVEEHERCAGNNTVQGTVKSKL